MSRPPQARETVLDAYEQILINDGERAATLNAVSEKAGVSKGGLLYHFPSKEALNDGILERLINLVRADVETMNKAPEGPTAYYLRTSTFENTKLDRALLSATRMAQSGSTKAADTLNQARELWRESIRSQITDETTVEIMMLIGDGLYYNNALGASTPNTDSDQFQTLLSQLDTLIKPQK